MSGKTGEGVEALLDRIVEVIPAPEGDPDAPTRAMIFDSVYDTYRGVVTYVRVVDGVLSTRQRVRMMSTVPPTSFLNWASSHPNQSLKKALVPARWAI